MFVGDGDKSVMQYSDKKYADGRQTPPASCCGERCLRIKKGSGQ